MATTTLLFLFMVAVRRICGPAVCVARFLPAVDGTKNFKLHHMGLGHSSHSAGSLAWIAQTRLARLAKNSTRRFVGAIDSDDYFPSALKYLTHVKNCNEIRKTVMK